MSRIDYFGRVAFLRMLMINLSPVASYVAGCARIQTAMAYARFTRPERLLKFLACGRCPACLGDLLGVEPDPADGCRNCGGAWRLSGA